MRRHELVLVSVIAAGVAIVAGCTSTPKQVPSLRPETAPAPKEIPSIRSEITSTPSGATVRLDDGVLGTTPFVANIPKKPAYAGPAVYSTGAFAATPDGMDRMFAKIKSHERQVYYTFVASKEGYKEDVQKFTIDYGIPPILHFDLHPLQTSTNQ